MTKDRLSERELRDEELAKLSVAPRSEKAPPRQKLMPLQEGESGIDHLLKVLGIAVLLCMLLSYLVGAIVVCVVLLVGFSGL